MYRLVIRRRYSAARLDIVRYMVCWSIEDCVEHTDYEAASVAAEWFAKLMTYINNTYWNLTLRHIPHPLYIAHHTHRVRPNSLCYQYRVPHHGIDRFLCQISTYPHQQYHCRRYLTSIQGNMTEGFPLAPLKDKVLPSTLTKMASFVSVYVYVCVCPHQLTEAARDREWAETI